MSVLQNINGSLYRMDASDLVQLAAVDTEGILGGTPGATTNGQTLVDQLAADDVQAQTDIGQIRTDLPNKLDIENQQILGAWNLNKYPYVSTTTTQSGVTFTDLGDGRIKASTNGGTSSGFGQFTFWNTSNPLSLVAGKKYYLSGAPVSGTTTDKVRLLIAFEDANNANRITVICPENGEVEFTMPVGYHFHWFSYAIVESGVSLNDVIVSPQISTQPRKVFSPYAMTNRELTTDFFTALFSHPVTLTSSDNLNDITTAGLYVVISSVPTNAPTGMSNTFAVVLVFNMGNSAAYTQIYIQGGWRQDSKHIAIRGFGGNPAAWSVWRYVTDATS